jgi:hypothetical protein
MIILLFLSRVFSDPTECDVIEGQIPTTPIDITGENCVDVRHCVFLALEAVGSGANANGGGIYVDAVTLSISDCAFVLCDAANGGGAIEDIGTGLTVVRCCIRDTSARDAGTAIDVFGGSGDKSITNTDIVGTHNTDERTAGTIYFAAASDYTFSALNFTECQLSYIPPEQWLFGWIPGGVGAAVYGYMEALGATWTFSFGTIVGNSGVSCIQSATTTAGEVFSCNFYNNQVLADYGVLHAEGSGMDVSHEFVLCAIGKHVRRGDFRFGRFTFGSRYDFSRNARAGRRRYRRPRRRPERRSMLFPIDARHCLRDGS